MTAADKYYLKAKDNYPYDLDAALEALEYGLSCDNEHPGLLTLMGRIYYHDLNNFEAAREYFELALFYNSDFVEAYYAYINFSLGMEDYSKAKRLLEKAKTVRGINKSKLYYAEALLYERQMDYTNAMGKVQLAKEYCLDKDGNIFYADELERIAAKVSQQEAQTKKIRVTVR